MPKEEPLRDTYEVPDDVDDIWDRLAAGTADSDGEEAAKAGEPEMKDGEDAGEVNK